MNTVLLNKFESYFESSKLHIFWKEKTGNYLGVSKGKLFNLNHHSERELIGKKDIDLYDQSGHTLHNNDLKVIHNQKQQIFIELVLKKDIQHHYLSYKDPIFSKTGKIIGIFGVAILLSRNGFLTRSDISEDFTEFLQRFYYNKDGFCSPKYQGGNSLTSRQKDCLHYLTKGMTIKQIAEVLAISPRTVEHYIEAIKDKFECKTKADLILKILQMNGELN